MHKQAYSSEEVEKDTRKRGEMQVSPASLQSVSQYTARKVDFFPLHLCKC